MAENTAGFWCSFGRLRPLPPSPAFGPSLQGAEGVRLVTAGQVSVKRPRSEARSPSSQTPSDAPPYDRFHLLSFPNPNRVNTLLCRCFGVWVGRCCFSRCCSAPSAPCPGAVLRPAGDVVGLAASRRPVQRLAQPSPVRSSSPEPTERGRRRARLSPSVRLAEQEKQKKKRAARGFAGSRRRRSGAEQQKKEERTPKEGSRFGSSSCCPLASAAARLPHCPLTGPGKPDIQPPARHVHQGVVQVAGERQGQGERLVLPRLDRFPRGLH